jgi:enoyl-CoA hydratase/carnithine racemase
MSEAPEVTTEVEDGVLIVTMNRPEAKNAMNKSQAEGISAAMDRLEADPELRCAILTGLAVRSVQAWTSRASCAANAPASKGAALAA